MKKILTFLTFIFLLYYISNSQPCLPGGITFSTQSEIDDFQTNYPGCTEIEGSVVINGSDITNLNGLSILTSFGENLDIIYNPVLTNFTGLENVTSISGSMRVEGNNIISDLSGLSGLTTIAGDFDIVENYLLSSVDGLSNLSNIQGSLFIRFNYVLVDLTGLQSLTTLGQDLLISGNDILTSLDGLDNLDPASISDLDIYFNISLSDCAIQSICDYLLAPGGTVNIHDNFDGCNSQQEVEYECTVVNITCLPDGITFNTQMEIDSFQVNYPDCRVIEGDLIIESDNGTDIVNLNGLNPLIGVEGNFHISNNFSLQNLNGLDSISFIDGDLEIVSNWDLTNIESLSELIMIGNGLKIVDCPLLTNLSGLDSLNFIGGSLDIIGNDGIENLEAFGELTEIQGSLNVSFNSMLESLSGLANIDAASIMNLSIKNNDSLSQCDVLSICNYLANPGGTILISNNNSGCNSVQEVEDLCFGPYQSCLPDGISFLTQVEIDNFSTNHPGCEVIEGDVIIESYNGTDITNLNGLSVLLGLEGSLQISNNMDLQNLSGLNNIAFIGGDLEISANESIESIEAMNSLLEVQGSLNISDNNILFSLSGLDNIDAASIMNLTIINNEALTECSIESICDYLVIPGGTTIISNNNSGCDSAQQVESLCPVGIKDNQLKTGIYVYPNPADKIIHINCDNTAEIHEITIYNHLGQIAISQKGFTNTIKISSLKSGLYIIEIRGNNWVSRKKLIVN